MTLLADVYSAVTKIDTILILPCWLNFALHHIELYKRYEITYTWFVRDHHLHLRQCCLIAYRICRQNLSACVQIQCIKRIKKSTTSISRCILRGKKIQFLINLMLKSIEYWVLRYEAVKFNILLYISSRISLQLVIIVLMLTAYTKIQE